jgi:hypothetical protein
MAALLDALGESASAVSLGDIGAATAAGADACTRSTFPTGAAVGGGGFELHEYHYGNERGSERGDERDPP